jgi:hypothetical protein
VTNTITQPEKEDSRREKKRAPRERKAQERQAWRPGQREAQSGEEFLSTLGRLSTERVWPEAWADEQAQAVGRER